MAPAANTKLESETNHHMEFDTFLTQKREDANAQREEFQLSAFMLQLFPLRLCVKNVPHANRLKFPEAVAHVPDVVQKFGGGAEFVPQPAHVGIDRAGVNHTIIAPHVPQKLLARSTYWNCPA